MDGYATAQNTETKKPLEYLTQNCNCNPTVYRTGTELYTVMFTWIDPVFLFFHSYAWLHFVPFVNISFIVNSCYFALKFSYQLQWQRKMILVYGAPLLGKYVTVCKLEHNIEETILYNMKEFLAYCSTRVY